MEGTHGFLPLVPLERLLPVPLVMLQMVDLARIVSVVQIEGVRLREAFCRSGIRPSEIAETIRVKTSRNAAVVKEPGDDGSLRIETTFGFEVRSDSEEEALQAEVRGTFELSYQVPNGEKFSPEELKAFAEFNAVFNAWPYWRELVQTSLARMSLPVLTVPVFRVTPRDTTNDSEPDDA